MCIASSEEWLSHSVPKGTRVGRWARTRSMTIFSGQGRKAVSSASRNMAKKAHDSCHENGRSSGHKGEAHCRNGISAGGSLAIVQLELFGQGSSNTPRPFSI